MAYDHGLADRVRVVLAERAGVTETKMFGGVTFLLGGHMCCGVAGDELVLRLGPERAAAALQRAHVRACDFTGRIMQGLVMVAPPGCASDADLRRWVELGVGVASSQPAKTPRARTTRRRAGHRR